MKLSTAHLRNVSFMRLAATGLLALSVSVALAQNVLAQNEASAATGNGEAVYAAIEKVPAKARARLNPFENDPQALAAGGKLFEQHCAECHGMKAEGTKRGPSLSNEQVQQATPGALFWILTNGVVRSGMPVWSKLPEPQRWQIIAFLKALRSRVSQLTAPFSWEPPSNQHL